MVRADAFTHPFADTVKTFRTASGRSGRFYSLPALARRYPSIHRLPVSLRIVLESVLRHCDGERVLPEHVAQLANWQPGAPRTDEIPFMVARVVLQDFTGVPLLADLAAMRSAAQRLRPRPEEDRAAGAGRSGGRPLGDGRPLRQQERAGSQHEAGIPAQQGALPVPQVGHAGLRDLRRGAAGLWHRAPGQPRIPRARRAPQGWSLLPRHPGWHRQPHHHDQRHRRGRLGRRRHRGRGRDAGPAGLVPHTRCGRLRTDRPAARGLHRDRPRADGDRDPAQTQGGGQVRRVLWRRHGLAAAARPRDHRQHGARIRCDHGFLPGG